MLEICAHLKELTIHIKKFKSKSPTWELEKWANEGVYFPPVVRIFAPLNYCCNWHDFLSRHCTILPANELYIYSSARIPMDIHPKLPLLRFRFGLTAASPVVKASDYGILGLSNDFMNVLEFNYDGKVMHGILLSKLSSSNQKYLDLRFSTLNSIVFFSVRNSKIIFPGHLEQIAIACPNLQWLNLSKCCNSLQNLKGLQSIVNMCENLQGLNIAKIPLVEVESYTLLWQVISSKAKLTHLTLSLCLLMVPNDVCTQRMVEIFQNCLNLLALEIVYGYCEECGEWPLEDLLLSSFPSLTYCKLSYDNPNILRNAITTCKNLKYFCYDNRAQVASFVPFNCVCKLQQLCIESRFTDIPDSFMDMISSHGGLEHMILSVRSITIRAIYTVISNSPNLMSFCAFIRQPLCDDNGGKVQSKDLKAKVKKEFGHHRLFTVGTFRVPVGNQFLCQNDMLAELNTDLNSLWS